MKPMLAVEAPKELRFPLYASPKLDGIRCLIKANLAMSRTLKLIPNNFVQGFLTQLGLDGLDGELIVGNPTAPDVYNTTNSGVMSQTGVPPFTYFVFDYFNGPTGEPYRVRYENLMRHKDYIERTSSVKILKQVLVSNQDELDIYEEDMLEHGYEGLILRSPDSPYKFGRSTAREGYMLKLKRFADGEAEVTGFEELMHNANEATLDELGFTKRSSAQENLVPMNTLGALVVKDLVTGIPFKIGTGYTRKHRDAIWAQRDKLVGTVVKYKHFEIGVKDAPRFPVWKGFRDRIDIGEPS